MPNSYPNERTTAIINITINNNNNNNNNNNILIIDIDVTVISYNQQILIPATQPQQLQQPQQPQQPPQQQSQQQTTSTSATTITPSTPQQPQQQQPHLSSPSDTTDRMNGDKGSPVSIPIPSDLGAGLRFLGEPKRRPSSSSSSAKPTPTRRQKKNRGQTAQQQHSQRAQQAQQSQQSQHSQHAQQAQHAQHAQPIQQQQHNAPQPQRTRIPPPLPLPQQAQQPQRAQQSQYARMPPLPLPPLQTQQQPQHPQQAQQRLPPIFTPPRASPPLFTSHRKRKRQRRENRGEEEEEEEQEEEEEAYVIRSVQPPQGLFGGMAVTPIGPLLPDHTTQFTGEIRFVEMYKKVYWCTLPIDPSALEDDMVKRILLEREESLGGTPSALSLYTALTWGAIAIGDRQAADSFYTHCLRIMGNIFDVDNLSTLLAALQLSLYSVASGDYGRAWYLALIARTMSERLRVMECRVYTYLMYLLCIREVLCDVEGDRNTDNDTSRISEKGIEKDEMMCLYLLYQKHLDLDPPSVIRLFIPTTNTTTATPLLSTTYATTTTSSPPSKITYTTTSSPPSKITYTTTSSNSPNSDSDEGKDDLERFSYQVLSECIACLITVVLQPEKYHSSPSPSTHSPTSGPTDHLSLLLFNRVLAASTLTSDVHTLPVNKGESDTKGSDSTSEGEEEKDTGSAILSCLEGLERSLFNRKRRKNSLPSCIHWSLMLCLLGLRATVSWQMGEKDVALKVAVQFCKRVAKLCRSYPFILPLFLSTVPQVLMIFDQSGRNDFVDRQIRFLHVLGRVFPCCSDVATRFEKTRIPKKQQKEQQKTRKKKEYKFHTVAV